MDQLQIDGFCVVPGPMPGDAFGALVTAYDRGMAEADPADRREGRTTVRVHNFVNRGSEFASIYVYPPLLDACWRTIGRPFKLSTMHGRTLLPEKPAQDLHVDFGRDHRGWPMVGFILMIDAFTDENGATCFLKGSHGRDTLREANGQVVKACGPAGSMIIYNGSVWHGHGANITGEPRRSIQGAFVATDVSS